MGRTGSRELVPVALTPGAGAECISKPVGRAHKCSLGVYVLCLGVVVMN